MTHSFPTRRSYDLGSKAQHFAPWLLKHAGEFNAEHRSSPGITCHHWPRSSAGLPRHASRLRSEEHTSELQSLMRISYAVFCLKKKKIRQHDCIPCSGYNNILTCLHTANSTA